MQFDRRITVSSGTAKDAVAIEYWNGSAWTAFNTMSTRADAPYTSYANAVLGYGDTDIGNPNPISYQIRFGDMSGWATTSVNSTTAYWIRYRVTNASVITQVPSIARVKLHTDRSEINKDGYIEHMGVARAVQKMTFGAARFLGPGTGSGLTSPGSVRIVPVNTGGISISASLATAEFNRNQDTSAAIFTEMPGQFCSSCPVTVKVTWVNGTGSGNVVLRINYVITKDTDVLGTPSGTPTATGATTGNTTIAIGTNGYQQSYTFSLNIPTYLPGQLLWIQLLRLGNTSASDTYTSTINVLSMTVKYRTWNSGTYSYI